MGPRRWVYAPTTRASAATSPSKCSRRRISRDPDRLKRFEQEARAAASLNHANILAAHDIGTDSGVAYIIT